MQKKKEKQGRPPKVKRKTAMNQDPGSTGGSARLRGSLPIHIHGSHHRLPTIDAPCILRLQGRQNSCAGHGRWYRIIPSLVRSSSVGPLTPSKRGYEAQTRPGGSSSTENSIRYHGPTACDLRLETADRNAPRSQLTYYPWSSRPELAVMGHRIDTEGFGTERPSWPALLTIPASMSRQASSGQSQAVIDEAPAR